jgi:hypothetical protein
MMKEMAKAALIKGGIKDPSESQVEILGVMITKYVEQQLKGLEKYGVPINPLDKYDWMDMKLDEDVDGAVYQISQTIQRKHELKRYDDTLLELVDLINKGEASLQDLERMLNKK